MYKCIYMIKVQSVSIIAICTEHGNLSVAEAYWGGLQKNSRYQPCSEFLMSLLLASREAGHDLFLSKPFTLHYHRT
jgi:hypothetical protein